MTTLFIVLIIIASGLVLIVGGIIYSIMAPKSMRNRIDRYVIAGADDAQAVSGRVVLDGEKRSQIRYQINNALSAFSSESLQVKISSTYWEITDTEFILIRLGVTLAGFLLGWAISGYLLGGVLLAMVFYIIPGFYLDRSIQSRQKKFQDQLLDTLVLIRGSVQSGLSLLQSLSVVIQEMSPPTSQEFSRVAREVQIGLPLNEALMNLSNRMNSEDLRLVVTAIIINSQTGGNLTMMLTSATNTIRDRIHLLGEVRALTSYGRSAAYLLTLMPFIAAVFIFLVNPSYFKNIWVDRPTQLIMLYAVSSLLIGNIWLRRVGKINV